MNKIEWETVDGFDILEPQLDDDCNALVIRAPLGLEDVIIMPGEDAIIPTGLIFSRVFKDYVIIPIHHTCVNQESDVYGRWEGKLRGNPIVHMSVVFDNIGHVYVHILNLGKKEIKIVSGSKIAYFCFSSIFSPSQRTSNPYI